MPSHASESPEDRVAAGRSTHADALIVARKLGEDLLELRTIAAKMADDLRAVLVVVDAVPPYPWRSGALKRQLREDLTDYELLGYDGDLKDEDAA